MKYRQISEIIRLFVLPEIQKRIDDGRVNADALPLELSNFCAYQQKKSDGSIIPIVELNEEVSLLYKAKFKNGQCNENMIGKHYHINEFEPNEFYIMPPEYEGKPCAYFYFNRIFLTPIFCWDCRPNNPEEENIDFKAKYPIIELSREKNIVKNIKPYEKMEVLIKNDWPPTPSYYPNVFIEMHKDNTTLSPDRLMSYIKNCFNKTYWDERILFWRQYIFFVERLNYIEKSIEEFFEGDYISSIHVLCPQFEGIIRDYLKENKIDVKSYRENIDLLRNLLYSRKVLLYPKKILEIILQYLKDGSFTQRSSKIKDPQKQANRPGIVHGIFSGFESEELALKFLLLLDGLAFVLLSDRMALGKL